MHNSEHLKWRQLDIHLVNINNVSQKSNWPLRFRFNIAFATKRLQNMVHQKNGTVKIRFITKTRDIKRTIRWKHETSKEETRDVSGRVVEKVIVIKNDKTLSNHIFWIIFFSHFSMLRIDSFAWLLMQIRY